MVKLYAAAFDEVKQEKKKKKNKKEKLEPIVEEEVKGEEVKEEEVKEEEVKEEEVKEEEVKEPPKLEEQKEEVKEPPKKKRKQSKPQKVDPEEAPQWFKKYLASLKTKEPKKRLVPQPPPTPTKSLYESNSLNNLYSKIFKRR